MKLRWTAGTLLLGLGLLALAQGVLAGLGTRAAEAAFTRGSLLLRLLPGGGDADLAFTHTWDGPAMQPGDRSHLALRVSNAGTVAGGWLELRAASTVTEAAAGPGAVAATPLDAVLRVAELRYNGADALPLVRDANGNGIPDLNDLALAPLAGLWLGDTGREHTLELILELDLHRAANEHQGDRVSTVLVLTLQQATAS